MSMHCVRGYHLYAFSAFVIFHAYCQCTNWLGLNQIKLRTRYPFPGRNGDKHITVRQRIWPDYQYFGEQHSTEIFSWQPVEIKAVSIQYTREAAVQVNYCHSASLAVLSLPYRSAALMRHLLAADRYSLRIHAYGSQTPLLLLFIYVTIKAANVRYNDPIGSRISEPHPSETGHQSRLGHRNYQPLKWGENISTHYLHAFLFFILYLYVSQWEMLIYSSITECSKNRIFKALQPRKKKAKSTWLKSLKS